MISAKRYLKLGFGFIVLLVGFIYVNPMPKLYNHIKLKSPYKLTLGTIEKENKQRNVSLNENLSCKPQRHFVYVKTHKTGSTTLLGVLGKFAFFHKLQIAPKNFLPFMGGYPGKIDPRFTFKRTKNHKLVPINTNPDGPVVFIHHTRYDPSMRDYMAADTKYVTILREPWNHLQSSFYYYYFPRAAIQVRTANCGGYPYFHIAQGRNIELIDYLHLAAENLNASVPWYFRSKNGQSHDLGLDPMLDDDVIINQEVERLTSEMDLVLITEYMDESMILLKDLFCMEWNDILFINNGKMHKYNKVDLPPNSMAMFKKMNKLDIALYSRFNNTLWKKIDKYGRKRMNDEVQYLHKLKLKMLSEKMNDKKIKFQKQRNRILNRNRSKYPGVENLGKSLYRISLNNIERSKMKTLLKFRIRNEMLFNMTKSTIDELVDYMLDNSGGCPL